ncbi:ExbD/TolR family protein [Lacinutrix salivirga]
MKHSRRSVPEINSGSMADIAFLLLIFFLVSTTISMDAGIQRKLPAPCPPNVDCTDKTNQRNVLSIYANANNQLLINNEVIKIEELKNTVKLFLDNNGDATCDYCNGMKLENASENPKKAVISLINDKSTSYSFYIQIQDEITAAYYELRAEYAKNVLKKAPNSLTKDEINLLKEKYPLLLSEAELK